MLMKNWVNNKILNILTQDAKLSDRAVAKKIGSVSQPTITRNRRKLEEEGIIKKYVAIPNFSKLDFPIIAFTLVRENNSSDPIFNPIEEKLWQENPVIWAFETSSGKLMLISIHRSFMDYQQFARNYNVVQQELCLTNNPIIPFSISQLIGEK